MQLLPISIISALSSNRQTIGAYLKLHSKTYEYFKNYNFDILLSSPFVTDYFDILLFAVT